MAKTRFPFQDNVGHVNPNIPAGYTYLAQFVAHDLSVSSSVDEGVDTAIQTVNLRTYPLHLDCLYGYGPSFEPACYELRTAKPIAQRIGWPKTRFRLDAISNEGFVRPDDSSAGPKRDIGRLIEMRGPASVGVALIADVRNDDNAVISQLTALFQLAHNAAMDLLEGGNEPATPATSALNFTIARMALTQAYRKIIRHDLLPRLLSPAIREYYETSDNAGSLTCNPADRFVSAEFAQAAYRIGHAMIREAYLFCGNPPVEHVLSDVLRRNSERNPPKTPHNRDWIIEWSNFFELGETPPRPSGRLEPRYETPLFDDTLFPPVADGKPAGLAYRDLVRSSSGELRKIDAMCQEIAAKDPDLAARSPWLTDRGLRRHAVRKWLEASRANDLGDLADEVVNNPPPVLYFLIEAAAAEDGFRAGPLASVIMAEIFYKALRMERGRRLDGLTPSEAAGRVFGAAIPQSMPDLIRWVDANMSSQDKTYCATDLPLI
ncbi:hypothetical protein H2509_18425 [Stappia sp. F7233]|uniref:Animal haem peroxidase n=1 Tax=Stappia albiluteola TaxID=2758565 RepID=A0A839AGX2_9HYPH|nr:peroxidase family protein [Stappia albiluteola]MBA5779110.1 hypothetical protein [Stappia albiluteola]